MIPEEDPTPHPKSLLQLAGQTIHRLAVTLLNSPFSSFVFQKIGLVSCEAGQSITEPLLEATIVH